MKNYRVNITASIPYPWTQEYTEAAATESAAVSRALKHYRRDIREYRGKAKRIVEFSLKITRLGVQDKTT